MGTGPIVEHRPRMHTNRNGMEGVEGEDEIIQRFDNSFIVVLT